MSGGGTDLRVNVAIHGFSFATLLGPAGVNVAIAVVGATELLVKAHFDPTRTPIEHHHTESVKSFLPDYDASADIRVVIELGEPTATRKWPHSKHP